MLSRLERSIPESARQEASFSGSSGQTPLSGDASLADRIKAVAAPYLRSLGLALFDLHVSGQQLRVFIDKDPAVSLEDCTKFSRLFSLALDVAEIMPQAYTLEVSSPGVNRPLRHEADFLRYLGKKIKVKTYEKIKMQKVFIGRLNDFREDAVFMTTDEGNEMRIPFDQVAKTCLEVEFALEKKRKVEQK